MAHQNISSGCLSQSGGNTPCAAWQLCWRPPARLCSAAPPSVGSEIQAGMHAMARRALATGWLASAGDKCLPTQEPGAAACVQNNQPTPMPSAWPMWAINAGGWMTPHFGMRSCDGACLRRRIRMGIPNGVCWLQFFSSAFCQAYIARHPSSFRIQNASRPRIWPAQGRSACDQWPSAPRNSSSASLFLRENR